MPKFYRVSARISAKAPQRLQSELWSFDGLLEPIIREGRGVGDDQSELKQAFERMVRPNVTRAMSSDPQLRSAAIITERFHRLPCS